MSHPYSCFFVLFFKFFEFSFSFTMHTSWPTGVWPTSRRTTITFAGSSPKFWEPFTRRIRPHSISIGGLQFGESLNLWGPCFKICNILKLSNANDCSKNRGKLFFTIQAWSPKLVHCNSSLKDLVKKDQHLFRNGLKCFFVDFSFNFKTFLLTEKIYFIFLY